MNNIFSSQQQLKRIEKILTGYLRLPFSSTTIPGSLMESVLASVRRGEVLNTYDFVDVINREHKIGWQVKATKASTPVTWKRAKIRDSQRLIEKSMESAEDLQNLGDSIIRFCNDHAEESLETYGLDAIGFARLLIHDDGTIDYFERLLCTVEEPKIFEESDFEWRWSKPKIAKKKEQLPALHGIHRGSGDKWFAWHGLGENQLHFNGEKSWWPRAGDKQMAQFRFPASRITQEQLMDLLDQLSTVA